MPEELTKVIHDCETGEVTILPLTQEELDDLAVRKAAFLEEKTALEAEEARKAELKEAALAKLTALGLTLEEAIAAL